MLRNTAYNAFRDIIVSLPLILFVYYNALHFLSDEVDMFVSYPCSKGSKPYRTLLLKKPRHQ